MHKYIKVTPNFHIFLNPAERFRTEVDLTFSSGGAFFENEDERGLTHLLEHCLVVQTQKYTKKELNRFVFERDFYKNASTSVLTQNIVLEGHKDYTLEMLELAINFALEPKFTQDVLDQEKNIVLREIDQRKGEPNYRLYRLITENVYTKDSRDYCEVIGDAEIVAKATLEQLESIHKRILETSHFILSVVGGNVDEEKIIELVNKFTKNLKSDKTHPIDENAKNYLHDFKYKPIVSDLGHEHCTLTLAIPCPISYENQKERNILSEVYFSFPEGTFYKKLREELGLVYSVDYNYDESLQLLNITLIGEIGILAQLVKETENLLTKTEEFINKEDVEIIKNLYIKRQEIASDNPNAAVNFMISVLLNYGVIADYEKYLDEVRAMDFEKVLDLGNKIKDGWKDIRLVAVSKNKEIEDLKLDGIN